MECGVSDVKDLAFSTRSFALLRWHIYPAWMGVDKPPPFVEKLGPHFECDYRFPIQVGIRICVFAPVPCKGRF